MNHQFKENIISLLQELLYRHDCVIVPDFGGFICNYMPARIDRTTHTLYPPVKLVSFNRNLNHNDGLLIGRISSVLDMGYDDARNLIGEFVGDIRQQLKNGEKVVFEKVGSFIYNEEGSVQFEPDRGSNFHLDSYGLGPVQWSPLEGFDIKKHEGLVERPGSRQASMRKILWRAAVFVPLLSVLVAVPLATNIFKSHVETTTLNPLASVEFEYNKKNIPVETATEQVNLNSKGLSEVVAPAVTANDKYYLITGSFKYEANAVSQSAMLREEGFKPEILEASNGFFRVSAMVCDNMDAALINKDNISKKFPGTWVSHVK